MMGMIEWIRDNLATLLVLSILCIMIIIIVRSLLLEKKAGKRSCGCNCSCCALQGKCHGEQ